MQEALVKAKENITNVSTEEVKFESIGVQLYKFVSKKNIMDCNEEQLCKLANTIISMANVPAYNNVFKKELIALVDTVLTTALAVSLGQQEMFDNFEKS